MRYLKMLGIAAVAAAALLASRGAGSASATVLCETNVTAGCGNAWDVPSGTNLKFGAEGSTTFTGPFGELLDTCTGGTIAGTTTATGSATTTVPFNITLILLSGCTRVTTVTIAFGTGEIHNPAGTKNGTVTFNGWTFILHDTFFGTCSFQMSNTDIGTLTGKNNTASGKPTLDIGADGSGKVPSENCGFSATWEGSYEYSGTTPFNVAAS